MIKVGTEIPGTAARTSTSLVARSAACAIPGLAQIRSALPQTWLAPGPVLALGAHSSPAMPPSPHRGKRSNITSHTASIVARSSTR